MTTEVSEENVRLRREVKRLIMECDPLKRNQKVLWSSDGMVGRQPTKNLVGKSTAVLVLPEAIRFSTYV